MAPVLDQTQAAAAPKPVAKTERPAALVKIILGILALMVLAYLGGHPRVQALEERLRISQVITIGFPFVILGLIARQPSVGILTDSVLAELGPLLRLGLGWIGFVVGFRFDVRLLGTLPPRATSLAGYATTLPFAAVVLGAGALLLAVGPAPDWRDPVFVRDALVLGAAGCMTTWRVVRLLPAGPARDAFRQVIRLEELAGVLGLAVVAAYFRPSGSEVTWQLPGTAWFFLTMGLGVTVAAVIYGIVHRGSAGPELVVLTLGSVAFSAGTAGYLHLSSVVVAFITGLVLANFPGEHRERMRDALMRLERPVYLLSLIVIGALWDVSDWRGWALMVVFVGARLAGKWLGVRLGLVRSGFSVTEGERKLLVSAPMGTLAIAIVINAQLLYPGGSIAYIVTAILGGAVASEVLAQVLARKAALGTPELSAAESTAGVDGGEG